MSKVRANQLCCGRGVGLGGAPTVVRGHLLGREGRGEKRRSWGGGGAVCRGSACWWVGDR